MWDVRGVPVPKKGTQERAPMSMRYLLLLLLLFNGRTPPYALFFFLAISLHNLKPLFIVTSFTCPLLAGLKNG